MVKHWARKRLRAADSSWQEWSGAAQRHPSPADWSDSIVYSIQVDRFNNGNWSNDELNLRDAERRERSNGELRGIPWWRHGGDIAGIVERLNYIKELGFNTLWVSPLFLGNGEYDGYCTMDPTKVDPNFGTAEELRELVSEAHKRGLRVILDINVGHLCDAETTYQRPAKHAACTRKWAFLHGHGDEGTSFFPEQGELALSDGFFPPFTEESFFFRCGAGDANHSNHSNRSGRSGRDPDRELRGHSNEAAVFGDPKAHVFSYNTRNRDWQEIFTDLHKWWLAYTDLDGFRLGDVDHVTEDFVAYFSSEIRDYAHFVGKRNFYIIGEASAAGHHEPQLLGHMDVGWHSSRTLKYRLAEIENRFTFNADFPMPGLGAVFNRGQSMTLRSVLLQRRHPLALPASFGYFWFGWPAYASEMRQLLPERLAHHIAWGGCFKNWFWWKEPEHSCAATSASQLWTGLEGPSLPRLLHHTPEAPELDAIPGVAEHRAQQEKALGTLGIALLFTLPGAPVIRYGQEQGFNGACPRWMDTDSQTNEILKDVCESDAAVAAHQDMFVGGPWRLGSAVESIDNLGYVGVDQARPPFTPPPGVLPPIVNDRYLRHGHGVTLALRRMAALRSTCPALARGRLAFHRTTLLWGGGTLVFSRRLYDEDVSFAHMQKRPAGLEIVVIAGLWGGEEERAADVGVVPLDEKIHRHADSWTKTNRKYTNALNISQTGYIIDAHTGAPKLDLRGIIVKPGEVLVFVHGSRMTEYDHALGVAGCKSFDFDTPLVQGHHADRCGNPAVKELLGLSAAFLLVAVVFVSYLRSQWQSNLAPIWKRCHFLASVLLVAGPGLAAAGAAMLVVPALLFPGLAVFGAAACALVAGFSLSLVAQCMGRVQLRGPQVEARAGERKRVTVVDPRELRRDGDSESVELTSGQPRQRPAGASSSSGAWQR